jgi:glycine hydroxymethyltransferase
MLEGDMKEIASLIGRAVREPAAGPEIAAAVRTLVSRFPIYPS